MAPTRTLIVALATLSSACGTIGPRTFQNLDDQVCVETALRRAPDPERLPDARDEFDRACDRGQAGACSALGVMYEQGLAVPEDPRRAARLYQQACKDGNDAGCVNLGLVYLEGSVVARNVAQAAELFRTGCEGGHPTGCAELGALHLRGIGVERDTTRGAALLNRACEDRPGACYRLAHAHEQGWLPPNPLRVLALYEKACVGGVSVACERMNHRYARKRDTPEPADDGRHPAEARCAEGSAKDCSTAGVAYYAGNGVERDLGRAVKLLTRACTGGYEPACHVLQPMLHGSCAKGDAESCHALSRLGEG